MMATTVVTTSASQSVLQPHDIYIKQEPMVKPMPPLASPTSVKEVQTSSASNNTMQQLNHNSNDIYNSKQSEQSMGDTGPMPPLASPATVLEVQTTSANQVLHNNDIYIKSEQMDGPMPPLASPATVMESVSTSGATISQAAVDKMREDSPPATVISLAPAQPYSRGAATQLTFAAPAYDLTNSGYTVQVNPGVSPPQYAAVAQADGHNNVQTVFLINDYNTYRDYYTTPTSGDQYQTVRQQLNATPAAVTYTQASVGHDQVVSQVSTNGGEGSFLDRYLRQAPITTTQNGTTYKGTLHGGLTVDLPSPDSGIGEAITPRGENGALTQASAILPVTASVILDQSVAVSLVAPPTPGSTGSNSNASTTPSGTPGTGSKSGSRRSWHEYGRNSEVDKVQIPKLFSDVGFKYYLESPISTSQRREDDRITYINKGQFYGITLEYIPDPDRPLKSATVKSLMLLVFREEKSHEDEIKAWQFWHSRQHSIKQRILDADTKNSSGIIGPIEEVTHNSISFYWNPLEGPAKINIAVQCLSTDFSNQKGVKGLPLHLQIDTFDDIREGSLPVNRGYCQIKVFCDKGAERKTRDEERRAAKRKQTATGNGRKKIEDMYHVTTERSEFYSMSDILKPPVLFTPSEELEKQMNAGEMNFYAGQTGGDMNAATFETGSNNLQTTIVNPPSPLPGIEPVKRERPSVDPLSASVEMAINQQAPVAKRAKIYPQDRGELHYPSMQAFNSHNNHNPAAHGHSLPLTPTAVVQRCQSPTAVLIFAKQENEEVFHPLHLVPPSLVGLAVAIQNKYKLEAKNIRHIFKRCRKGITVQMDDEMVKHYCNEDTCLLEVHQVDEQTHDITLVEYETGH